VLQASRSSVTQVLSVHPVRPVARACPKLVEPCSARTPAHDTGLCMSQRPSGRPSRIHGHAASTPFPSGPDGCPSGKRLLTYRPSETPTSERDRRRGVPADPGLPHASACSVSTEQALPPRSRPSEARWATGPASPPGRRRGVPRHGLGSRLR
jgi:hypothetical protein